MAKLGQVPHLLELALTYRNNREIFYSLLFSINQNFLWLPFELQSFCLLESWIPVIFGRGFNKENGNQYLELFSYLIRKADLYLLSESHILQSAMQHDLNQHTIYFLQCFLLLTKNCVLKNRHDLLQYLLDIGLLEYLNAAISITKRDTHLSHESRSLILLNNKIIRNLRRLTKFDQYRSVVLRTNFPSDVRATLMTSTDDYDR